MQEMTLVCYHCQARWVVLPPISRREDCPQCHRDAHICLNCQFYDPHAHHSCRESQADFVQEKDKSNFCNYFVPQTNMSGSSQIESTKQRLDRLFKTPSHPPHPEATKPADLKAEIAKFIERKNKK